MVLRDDIALNRWCSTTNTPFSTLPPRNSPSSTTHRYSSCGLLHLPKNFYWGGASESRISREVGGISSLQSPRRLWYVWATPCRPADQHLPRPCPFTFSPAHPDDLFFAC